MTRAETPIDQEYKEAVRREWTAAASGWRKWIDVTEAEAGGGAVTGALLQQARLRPGDVVLDVGSGYGEPGLSAAAEVGEHGQVTCLDISGDMLAHAEVRARTAGLTNVRFVEGDIEATELGAGSYDVVLSRAALMYASDPQQTVARLHRALRPGGRLAIAVWGTPDQVAFATPIGVIVESLGIEPPTGGPGPFALGGSGALEQLVQRAGFIDVAAGTALAVYELPDRDACTQWLRDCAPPITELIADQPTAVQTEVWERVTAAWVPFSGEDGRVRLPCVAVWASGIKPA